jgi:hypothetical protein
MAAAAITPRASDTAFSPASFPGVNFDICTYSPEVILCGAILHTGCELWPNVPAESPALSLFYAKSLKAKNISAVNFQEETVFL